MGFTLGVDNALAPAIKWRALCNIGAGPNMPTTLSLSERWACVEAAPGQNWMDIACFDSEDSIIQESRVFVTILDNRDYIFDFTTEALLDVTGTVSNISGILDMMITLMIVVMMMGMIQKQM